MTKISTSIRIDEELWKQWQIFVLQKTGKGRRGSNEMENALREYMENYENRGKTK
jgi:hypothetical protein